MDGGLFHEDFLKGINWEVSILNIIVDLISNVTLFSGLRVAHGIIIYIQSPRLTEDGDFYVIAETEGAESRRMLLNKANMMQSIPQSLLT